MQKGEFKAAKILPLVGKYLSEASKQGGALGKRLQQLEVIENRMKTSWTQMLDSFYKSGAESGLIDLYKTLDEIFFSISNNNKAGGFLKGFFEAANTSIKEAYVWILRLKYTIEDLTGLNLDPEILGKASYWLTLAAAFNMFGKSVRFLMGGGVLQGLIAWLSGGKLAGAVAEAAAASSKAGPLAIAGSLMGKALGVAIVAAAAYELGSWLRDNVGWIKSFGDYLGEKAGHLVMPSEADKQALSFVIGSMEGKGFDQAWSAGQPLWMQQQKPSELTIKIEKSDDIDKYIKATINGENAKIVQSILPSGWTSTSAKQ